MREEGRERGARNGKGKREEMLLIFLHFKIIN